MELTYILRFQHGHLYWSHPVYDVESGRDFFHFVLNRTHQQWPVSNASITGYGPDGEERMVMKWMRIRGRPIDDGWSHPALSADGRDYKYQPNPSC